MNGRQEEILEDDTILVKMPLDKILAKLKSSGAKNNYLPLCVEFDECPDEQEFPGFVVAAVKDGLPFTAFLVSKTQEAANDYSAKMKKILDIVAPGRDAPTNIDKWRSQNAVWPAASAALADLQNLSWADYAKKYDSVVQASIVKKKPITEEDFNAAKEEIVTGLRKNVDDYHEKHSKIPRTEVSSHVLNEGTDYLSFMQTFEDQEKRGKELNNVVYKKDKTHFMNKVCKNAWIMGYDQKSIQHVVLKFNGMVVSISIKDLLANAAEVNNQLDPTEVRETLGILLGSIYHKYVAGSDGSSIGTFAQLAIEAANQFTRLQHLQTAEVEHSTRRLPQQSRTIDAPKTEKRGSAGRESVVPHSVFRPASPRLGASPALTSSASNDANPGAFVPKKNGKI